MGFSKYPNQIDTSTELPVTVDLKTPVSAEVINRLRDAALAIEGELGILPRGIYGTVRERLDKLDIGISTISVNIGSIDAVLDEGTVVREHVRELNFIGPATVASAASTPNRVDITITASGSGGSSIFQEQETISVLVNGQTAFTISSTPQDDSAVEMYVNGFKQEFGVDYTVSGTAVSYIGPLSLITTDVVEFWYIAVGGDIISQEQETIAVTVLGQTSFVLTSVPIDPTAVKMYVNGQKQENATDYSVVSNVVTYSGPLTLDVTDIVEFWYVISGLAAGGSGGGGGESLAATLLIGNITDGYDIVISDGDLIVGSNGVAAFAGGTIDIAGGNATGSGAGGDLLLSGGDGLGTGGGGNTAIISGTSATGSAGNITVTSGNGPIAAGDITLRTGSTSGVGADIIFDLTNAGASSDGYIRFQEDGTTFLEFTSGSAKIISPSNIILHSNGTSVLTLNGGASPTLDVIANISVTGSTLAFVSDVATTIGQQSTSGIDGSQLTIYAQSVTGGGNHAGGDLVMRAGAGQGIPNDGYVIITDTTGVVDILKVVSDTPEVIIDGKLTVTGLIDPTGLVLDEQAAGFGAANVSSGKGAIWVDNTTAPNRLIFTNEDGYDSILSGIGSGNETLSQTLFLGNTTDGYDIIVSDVDNILLDHTTADFNLQFNNTVALAGKAINITGQESTTSQGGAIHVTGGFGSAGAGGDVFIDGGDGASGAGGDVQIAAGQTNSASGTAGAVNIYGGLATVSSGSGGDIYAEAGKSAGTGQDGNINLVVWEHSAATSLHGKITFGGLVSEAPQIFLRFYRDNTSNGEAMIEFDADAISPIITQAATSGSAEDISIIAQSTSAASGGGHILFSGGTSDGGADGYVMSLSDLYINNKDILFYGDGVASNITYSDAATTTGGALTFKSQTGGGTGGLITVQGGDGGANSTGGGAILRGGTGGDTTGAGGDIVVTGGSGGSNGNGGNTGLKGGPASGGTMDIGGIFTAYAGVATGAGGNITAIAGNAYVSTNQNGGLAGIASGNGDGTGSGGAILLTAGDSGTGATGDGGDITVTGGDAVSSDGYGGTITLTSGAGTGNGGNGSIYFNLVSGAATSNNIFDFQADASSIMQLQPFGSTPTIEFVAATNILVQRGAAVDNSTTNITIAGGNSTGSLNDGGPVAIMGGQGGSVSAGGSATVIGGNGGINGSGGSANVAGGYGGASSGAGGDAQITGGIPTNGDGGPVLITATSGVGINKNGGNVEIVSGAASDTFGMDGNIIFDMTTQALDGYIKMQIDSIDAFTLDGYGVLFLADAIVPPVISPTGGGLMYSEGGAGKWRSPSGTVTTFGAADPHCPKCGRDFTLEWESSKYGYMAACMWCLTDAITEAGINTSEFVIKTKA